MDKQVIRIILLPLFILVHFVSLFSQVSPATSNQIITCLERLKDTPTPVIFQNTLEVNNHGGHLQGIQYFKHKNGNYYILSGSSEDYSYYSIVKAGRENRVIYINKLMEKPFKHAGGFQIFESFMAIGVEDNLAKDKSKVFIFKLDTPGKPPEKPLAVINREGLTRRATAGCVGITILRGKVLVVVGDWDTEHLDFYIIDHEKLGTDGGVFELEYSIDIRNTDKTGWIDEKWLAYQNINFIHDDYGQLYLAGMTSDENGENVIDLFRLETEDLSSFKLFKIHTRKFRQNEHTDFRWGSGIYIADDQQLKLYSCGEHIEENSVIHIYE